MSQSDQFLTWQNAIDKATQRATEEIFTTGELQALLDNLCDMEGSPLQGIEVKISQKEIECTLKTTGDYDGIEPTTLKDPLTTVDGISADVTIRAWATSGRAVATSHWYQKVLELLRAAWFAELRQNNKGLIDFRSNVIRSRLPRSINRLLQESTQQDVFAVYIDLDKFKRINDDLGHDIGDKALEYMCACIQKIADQASILGSRNGGDEFSLLVVGTPIVRLLDLLDQLNINVEAKKFSDKEYTIGMTAGIAPVSGTHTPEDFDEALKEAEAATKDAKSGKKRGTVSISSMAAHPTTSLNSKTYAKLGAVIARGGQSQIYPFANIILNIISSKVAAYIVNGVIVEDFEAKINKAIAWLGIQVTSDFHEENLYGEECVTSSLGKIEIALALYHGCARVFTKSLAIDDFKAHSFALRFKADGADAALVLNGTAIWGQCAGSDEMDLGKPIHITDNTQEFLSTTVAFQVGFQTRIYSASGRLLPNYLFSETVVVDDRPKIGGGLPDFWQAGVANIISAVGKNPNFNMVLLVGDPANAPETTKRIKGQVLSNSDELAVITALSKEEVKNCLLRLKQSVKCENDPEQILELLYRESLALCTWKGANKPRTNEKIPKLKRKLEFGPIALGALDGVQCETAAQAYPAIVEIMRTGETASMTFDDASQPLREIVGFKLVLANPTQDPVPDYWTDQETAFREYASGVLLTEDGVISKSFSKDGQYRAFIEQLAGYCNPESSQKSTRRAILVVENVVDNSKLRPLGLVSVWAAPRHHPGGCSVEFCFVWRTVETLVGLPYSLFGSIQLAEQVVEQIKTGLHAKLGTQIRVNVGRLTYLALSLHMRVDTFHRRIAKRIADAASD